MEERDFSFIKKYKYVMLGLLLLSEVIVALLVNSIRTSGYEVTSNSYFQDNPLINVVGYDNENWNFSWVENDEPYITFKQDVKSDGCLVVFDSVQDTDINITVWYMDETGLILNEFEEVLPKGERILNLQGITSGTAIISLGINHDFSLYEIAQSKTVSHPAKKTVMLLIAVAVVFAVFVLLYKKRIFYQKISGIHIDIDKAGVLRNLIPIVCMAVILLIVGLVFNDKNISLAGKTFNINHKTLYLIMILFAGIYLLIANRKSLEKNIALFGTIIILLVGTVYVFVEPAFNGIAWDDEIHYRDASSLSHIVDGKKSLSDRNNFRYYPTVALDRYGYDKETNDKNIQMYDKVDRLGFYYKDTEFKFATSKLVYLPMSLGLALSRGACLPYHICFIIGKLFNLLFYAMLCYLAMKKLRHGSIVILLFALIPTNIFMAGSYSYDPWLIALVIYAYAMIFSQREREGEHMDKKTMFMIPIALFLSTLSKLVYFVMAVPALVIPKERFKDKKQRKLYTILCILAIILPFVVMYINNIANAGVGDTRGGDTVNATKQIEFILGNFGFVANTIIDFLKVFLNPLSFVGLSYMNHLSYNGVIIGGRITLAFVVLMSLICHEDKDRKAFPIWYRLCVLLLYVGVGAICAVTMYISFTPVGADHVAGCQGRYLLPAIFPALYVLTRIPTKKCVADVLGRKNVYMIAGLGMLLINLFCIWKGCVCYYV